VDFAGGYIAEYGQGDPATPLDLGTAEELKAASEQDELDEDQREVFRQGYRFARIAEHYRDAMLNKDEAAMALLERICLFRLGVDCDTLAAIFTGRKAKNVSGKALAALNAEQLQSKLDWLVRMRIVEATPGNPKRERGTTEDSAPSPSLTRRVTNTDALYSIHPAVRDGFLSGISRDAALAGHEAVRIRSGSLSRRRPRRESVRSHHARPAGRDRPPHAPVRPCPGSLGHLLHSDRWFQELGLSAGCVRTGRADLPDVCWRPATGG
jgi:hypothetical protein